MIWPDLYWKNMMSLLAAPELHAYLRCLVLGAAGLGYALFQCRTRPSRETVLKRLVLAAAFVLWAAEQLIPQKRLTLFLDDAVIAAFVLDLIWIIQGEIKAGGRSFVTSVPDSVEGLETQERKASLRAQ